MYLITFLLNKSLTFIQFKIIILNLNFFELVDLLLLLKIYIILLIQTFILINCFLPFFAFSIFNYLRRNYLLQFWNLIRTKSALVFKINQFLLKLKLRVIISGLSIGLSRHSIIQRYLFRIVIMEFIQLIFTDILILQISRIIM